MAWTALPGKVSKHVLKVSVICLLGCSDHVFSVKAQVSLAVVGCFVLVILKVRKSQILFSGTAAGFFP